MNYLLPIYEKEITTEEKEVVCEVDGNSYPVSQMKRDVDGCNWIHKLNVLTYLEGIKGTVTDEEFKNLENQLTTK